MQGNLVDDVSGTTVGPAHRVKPKTKISIFIARWKFEIKNPLGTLTVSEEMHAVSQLVEALRYKPEGRGSILHEFIGTFPAALFPRGRLGL